MTCSHAIEQALRDVCATLSANRQRTSRLPDDRAVSYLRAILGAPPLHFYLERSGDIASSFLVRALIRAVSDTQVPHRTTLNQVSELMRDSEVDRIVPNTPPAKSSD